MDISELKDSTIVPGSKKIKKKSYTWVYYLKVQNATKSKFGCCKLYTSIFFNFFCMLDAITCTYVTFVTDTL